MVQLITLVALAQVGTPFPLGDFTPGTRSGPTFGGAFAVDAGFLLYGQSPEGVEWWAASEASSDLTLVADQNPSGNGVSVVMGQVAGRVLFSGSDGAHGVELWVTDGTLAGTLPLTDLNPGPGSTSFLDWVVTAGRLYFAAYTPATGCNLYRSDGTVGGTVLVTALAPTSPRVALRRAGSLVWFRVNNTYGVSDGTAAGTRVVFTSTQTFDDFAVVQNRLLFANNGSELWVLDSAQPDAGLTNLTTAPSTAIGLTGAERGVMVSFSPACDDSGCSPPIPSMFWSGSGALIQLPSVVAPFVSKGELYYALSATDRSVWQATNTPDGGFVQLPGATWPFLLLGEGFGNSQFVYDGTTVTPNPVAGWEPFGLAGDRLLLRRAANPNYEYLLYNRLTKSSKPLAFAAQQGADSAPRSFVTVGAQALFVMSTPATGAEVFGVYPDAGVHLVSDSVPGLVGTQENLIGGPGFAVLRPSVPSDAVLVTRGSPADTERLVLPSVPGRLAAGLPKGLALFSTDALWVLAPGATPNLVPLPAALGSGGVAAGGQGVFFTAVSIFGEELWFSDGTATGTLELDLSPGFTSSAPEQLTSFGSGIAFSAFSATAGRELWFSDGTREGSRLLADLAPGVLSARPQGLIALGSSLVFFADDGVHGLELWRWDGQQALLVTELVPGPAGVVPQRGVAVAGAAAYVVRFPDGTQRLIHTDGTEAGTQELARLGSNTWLSAAAGALFFDNATLKEGVEPWGWWPPLMTAQLLADIVVGPGSSYPGPGSPAGDLFVFSARSVATGSEPWAVRFDSSPPVITPHLEGVATDAGTYVSDVSVLFEVVDRESQLATSGCDAALVTQDTAGATFRCVARSAGGVAEREVTVRRDALAPVLTCPASVLWEGGAVDLQVTAHDGLDPHPLVVFEPPLSEVTPLTEAITVTARDATGNASSCTVAVLLTEAPPPRAAVARLGCASTGVAPVVWLALAMLGQRGRRRARATEC